VMTFKNEGYSFGGFRYVSPASTLIIGYTVPGAVPSKSGVAPLGQAEEADPDPTGTEQYVTYNDLRSSSDLYHTTLNAPGIASNHGALSLNGAQYLADHGYNYAQILHYYYGADARLTVADSGYNFKTPSLNNIVVSPHIVPDDPGLPATKTLADFEKTE